MGVKRYSATTVGPLLSTHLHTTSDSLFLADPGYPASSVQKHPQGCAAAGSLYLESFRRPPQPTTPVSARVFPQDPQKPTLPNSTAALPFYPAPAELLPHLQVSLARCSPAHHQQLFCLRRRLLPHLTHSSLHYTTPITSFAFRSHLVSILSGFRGVSILSFIAMTV